MEGHRTGRGARLRAAGLLACIVAILPAAPLAADDLSDFQFALNAYDAGDYPLAIERFRALLAKEPPVKSGALLVEIHKYLGASCMFTGAAEAARKEFEELLLIDPEHELDPILFPTEVLDEFFTVKQGLAEKLKAVVEGKKKKEQEKLEKRKQLKEAWGKLVADAAAPRYLRATVKESNVLVALLPFGAGQLQNGHMKKGYAFLGVQAALLAGNVATYWVWDSYRRKAAGDELKAKQYGETAGSWKIANHVFFWVLLASMVAGIIDSLVFYRPTRVVYEAVGEKDIPKKYHTKKDVPSIDIDDILE